MDEKEAKKLSLKLIETAEAAYFTTIDKNGFPQTRAMLNLRNKKQYPSLIKVFNGHQEDFLIYFTTNTSSSKLVQIKENPKVSVYYCRPGEWHGLMLGGEIRIVTEPEILKALWQEGWEMYYPGGLKDPDYTILALEPAFANCYRQLDSSHFAFLEGDADSQL